MVYIWAWQAPPLQPDLMDLLKHRRRRAEPQTRAAIGPPGISTDRKPACVKAVTNSVG